MVDNDILEVALVGLCLLLGLMLCFFGYRLFHCSLFTIAFVAGGAIAAFFAPLLTDLSAVSWLVCILVGALCGFLAVRLVSMGMLIAGFCGGSVFAVLFLSLAGYSDPLGPLIVLPIASGMICGVFTLMYKKPAFVTTTSLLGATLLAFVIGLIIQEYLRVPSSINYSKYDAFWDDTWWILFAILLALIGVGMLLQFTVTGKGIYHESTVDVGTSIDTQTQFRQDPNRYEDLPTPRITKASDASENRAPIEIVSIPSIAAEIETSGSFADLLAAIALGLICCFIVVLMIRKPALIRTAAISAVGSFIGYLLYWVLDAGNSPATIWVTMLALLLARSFGTAWLEVYQERQNGQSEPATEPVTVQQQQEGEHQVETNEHAQPKGPEEDNMQPKFA